MRLAVLIPAYNERALLGHLVGRLLETPPPRTPGGEACERVVVVVDDGSTDGTAEEVRRLGSLDGIVCEHHDRNRGKGAAIRTALGIALGPRVGADVVLIQDADLEYDPADHGAVLRPILEGRADAVIGSRFLGHSHRVLYYWHAVANGWITRLSNMLTNLNLTDIECCSKAFTAEVGRGLRIRENRFGVEPELVARMARMRLAREGGGERRARIYEVAVSYAGRTYEEGKKITWRDGVSAVRCIVRYNVLGG